jgi:hypothetical protein
MVRWLGEPASVHQCRLEGGGIGRIATQLSEPHRGSGLCFEAFDLSTARATDTGFGLDVLFHLGFLLPLVARDAPASRRTRLEASLAAGEILDAG